MEKFAKRLLNGSVRSILPLLLALVVLFTAGNASANNVKGTGTGTDTYDGVPASGPEDTTFEDDDWSDMGTGTDFEEICVEVTGITGEDIEFIMVPANVPGPGEKGFDLDAFFDKMVGDGELFEGELFAYYFGSETGLTDPGVKIYSIKYDESVEATTVSFEEFIKSVKLSLIPNTTVKKIDCSDSLPEFEEICVEVTGITGADTEFIMVPANVPGPGEKGFDLNAFFDRMVGSGEVFKGEIFACYFGTETELTDPGVRIYSIEYDESVAATSVPFEDFIKSAKVSLIPNTTVKKIDCPDPQPEPGAVCVEVSGIEGEYVEFTIVPANLPGPGEKGFSKTAFFDNSLGGGVLYEGEIFADYYGTEEQLKNPGVKIYKFEYDENAAAGATETEETEDLLDNVSFKLIPNAKVKQVQCTETVPEDDEIDWDDSGWDDLEWEDQ
ncbi:MAG: hypothetical protein GY737_18605 [Desulfobacteraceae bacterium]|nr:hypothetical protein [Desulfobacteraceae bacterium]